MIIRNSSGSVIQSVEDWLEYAPPKKGKAQWKDYRSAKELARAWFRPNMPSELRALLDSHPKFHDFTIEEAIPECQIQLDNFGGETRNADLVLVGHCGDGPCIVTIEAKADEEFGPLVGEYADKKAGTSSKVPERIDLLLRSMFGHGLDERLGHLRYQLLHGAAATLIEARNRSARRAAFIVHEFLSAQTHPDKVKRNNEDWAYFLSLLGHQGGELPISGSLLGPFTVPGGNHVPADIPLFVGKGSVTLS
jgi:hypothetical protein